MYGAVPSSTPSCVPPTVIVGEFAIWGPLPVPPIALARPKSSTFTRPSGVILMLAGLRSRCTMPRSCAASSASITWLAMLTTSSMGNPRRDADG